MLAASVQQSSQNFFLSGARMNACELHEPERWSRLARYRGTSLTGAGNASSTCCTICACNCGSLRLKGLGNGARHDLFDLTCCPSFCF